ncbi:MAG TPA: AAA family ATPase [archaeon]|nr:AAA family ATPase [archaeon]
MEGQPVNLAVMSSLPRAGKTRIARFLREEFGFYRVGSDDIRESVYGPEWPTSYAAKSDDRLFYAMKHLANWATIDCEEDVVVDSTNWNKRYRDLFFGENPSKKTLIVVRADKEVLRERWKQSGYDVNSPYTLDDWIRVWEEPEINAGYDVIELKGDDEKDFEEAKRILFERFRPQRVDAGIPLGA